MPRPRGCREAGPGNPSHPGPSPTPCAACPRLPGLCSCAPGSAPPPRHRPRQRPVDLPQFRVPDSVPRTRADVIYGAQARWPLRLPKPQNFFKEQCKWEHQKPSLRADTTDCFMKTAAGMWRKSPLQVGQEPQAAL
ncbi:PREDICTED: uncharacterized protein LOC108523465 [Rhinopithecus bieti]|uniref:uncharacterized protein LOC108523465 n=1 Tax=Rhinopithecus bieti TaxID=61621 RepID=UPI00083C2C20|nr:PREDICTED: uncharacterized protein LOC108523465 [Rhinopithecus bieti]